MSVRLSTVSFFAHSIAVLVSLSVAVPAFALPRTWIGGNVGGASSFI